MNLQEFKAWFEGFTENMKGAPSEKAWKRIQERVAEITEKPTEVRYFYDHYWRPYVSYSGTGLQGLCSATASKLTATNSIDMTLFQDSGQAFSALGQAEAQSLS